jgi:hypothetical protein
MERRKQRRGDGEVTDWETIALKRVERHVESLSDEPTAQRDTLQHPGWEDAAILALRRRLRDLKN